MYFALNKFLKTYTSKQNPFPIVTDICQGFLAWKLDSVDSSFYTKSLITNNAISKKNLRCLFNHKKGFVSTAVIWNFVSKYMY